MKYRLSREICVPYRFACSLFALALLSASTVALAQAPARPAAQAPRPAGSNAAPISRQSFIVTMDGEYKKIDANNDGVVTRAELEVSQQRARVAALTLQARQLFLRYDTDKNGVLSVAEFVYATTGGPQAKPNVTPMITRLDTNRDGKVTLIEYRTMTLANVDKLDTDKDGVASLAEQRAAGIIK
jgi:Ca2+-binding EF-hand superfamily protein